MNSEQITAESQCHLLHGWLTSLVLHGLLLCVAILSVRQSPVTLPVERFQWDVTLIQSTQVPEASVTATNASAQSIQERPAPPSTEGYRSPLAGTPYPKSVGTVQPMVDHEEIRAASPNTGSSTPQTASQVESTIVEPTPIPPPTANEPSQPSVAQTDPHPQESPATGTATASTSTIGDPIPSSVDPLPSPVVTATIANPVPSSKQDYNWLQQAIFRKLDELKQSSRPQLDGLQPLKVLVKAVVSDEGMLLESEVVKSSGLDRIDQEAMALVRRAFPMQFDRTIDRRQIVMRIPISYSRE